LQRLEDPSESDSPPVFWAGPVLAGGRLWLVNSLGHLAAFSPQDGNPLYDEELADGFFIPPVVAGSVMYLVSDDGRLMALK
jgi:outer membrane protein assembly factor BamB